MIPNSFILKRIGAAAIMVATIGVATGLKADKTTFLKPGEIPGTTRPLSFPTGQCTGDLYLEPESGPGWDPECVRLSGQWEYLAAAQGDVPVPEGRNVQLIVHLALSQRESSRMFRQNPLRHRRAVTDRVRKDPEDLSGLSQLDPNALFRLSISTAMYQRTGTDPSIFEPIHHLTGLRMLSLKNTGVTDEGLEHLKALRSLKALEMMEFSISSRGLAVLRDLPDLMYLDLDMGVTDAGLRHVGQHRNLRWLRIRTGNIWGPGLAQLANMPRLERLCIWGTRPIFDRHIKYLENLTHLKSLTLWGVADRLTDASLASIGKLKNLEELYFLRTSARFTVAGIAHLRDLKKLRKTDLAQIWTGPQGMRNGDELVKQLAANLPHLESIKGINYLSAEGMKTVTAFKNLKCLGVELKNRRHGYYGPTGVSHLASLRGLEELHLTGSDALSDADVASLASLSRLKELFISGQNVTERGIALIGKLKELEKLTIFCPVTRNALNQLNGLANLQHLQVNAHRRGNSSVADHSDELMLDLSGLKKMKDMHLSGLPLRDNDLAFLKNMPVLERLMIQSKSTLTGESLLSLADLPELNHLLINQLSDCTDKDLAHLNNLSKLRYLTLIGDINDAALSSLDDLSSLWSLHVDTDSPIRRETVIDLTRSNPSIEYIHINELPKFSTRRPPQPGRKRASRPRTIRRAPRPRR